MTSPTISVITPVFNRVRTIEACLESVAAQSHRNVEHVIVDGGSTDGTLDVIRAHAARLGPWRTGPDRGLYDAINQGLRMASGELVAVLGADDVYADDQVLADVADLFQTTDCSLCYGDLIYLSQQGRVVRRWVSGPFRPTRLERGWMPPHPTFFVRRSLHEELGYYNLTFRIAADYELMLRFLGRQDVQVAYLPRTLVLMRTGGVSNTPSNLLDKSLEDLRAYRHHGRRRALRAILLKNLSKLPQFLRGALP